jgi:hypothetical protein
MKQDLGINLKAFAASKASEAENPSALRTPISFELFL